MSKEKKKTLRNKILKVRDSLIKFNYLYAIISKN